MTIRHPSPEELAAFADGRLASEEYAAIRAHVTSCMACLAAYTHAVESHSASGGEVPAELFVAAMAVPSATRTAPRAPVHARRRMPSLAWALGVVAVVSVGTWAIVSVRARDQLGGVSLAPLRTSARAMSMSLEDQLVVPGGESWADRVDGTAMRSGVGRPPGEVEGTVERLAAGRFSSPRQRTAAARWLAVGHLALDDLTSARIELEAALVEAPRDYDLLVLAAVRAHRASEMAAAERYLRRAMEARPDDALAQLDLGITLAGKPERRAESIALLEQVAARDKGPLAARARQVLAQPR